MCFWENGKEAKKKSRRDLRSPAKQTNQWLAYAWRLKLCFAKQCMFLLLYRKHRKHKDVYTRYDRQKPEKNQEKSARSNGERGENGKLSTFRICFLNRDAKKESRENQNAFLFEEAKGSESRNVSYILVIRHGSETRFRESFAANDRGAPRLRQSFRFRQLNGNWGIWLGNWVHTQCTHTPLHSGEAMRLLLLVVAH